MNNIFGFMLCIVLIYSTGYFSGSARKERSLRDSYRDQVAELINKHREAVDNHIAKQQGHLDEIQEIQNVYNNSLIVMRSEYERRLHESEERGNVYRKRVSSASTECREIAEHASQLDRSLTEGRELVRELRDHIKQSELINSEIVKNLVNDRNFLNGR